MDTPTHHNPEFLGTLAHWRESMAKATFEVSEDLRNRLLADFRDILGESPEAWRGLFMTLDAQACLLGDLQQQYPTDPGLLRFVSIVTHLMQAVLLSPEIAVLEVLHSR